MLASKNQAAEKYVQCNFGRLHNHEEQTEEMLLLSGVTTPSDSVSLGE